MKKYDMREMLLTPPEAERARQAGNLQRLQEGAPSNIRGDYENRAIAVAQMWKIADWFQNSEHWLLDYEIAQEMKSVATKMEVEALPRYERPEEGPQS